MHYHTRSFHMSDSMEPFFVWMQRHKIFFHLEVKNMDLWKLASEFFKVITNLPVIIGTVKALILAVEETGVAGADKKKAVIDSLVKTMKEAFEIDLAPYTAWISWLIDGIVNVFNATGYFKHEKK